MSGKKSAVDYGPLKKLIGTWKGKKGVDIAPDPDGTEKNIYEEALTFEPAEETTNAEKETLVALRYRQVVHRISDKKKIHDQVGYLLWHAKTNRIINSFVIPRGVAVVSIGKLKISTNGLEIKTKALASGNAPGISQTTFMHKEAKTFSFNFYLKLSKNKLTYSQLTKVKIYGKLFNHTDDSLLTKNK